MLDLKASLVDPQVAKIVTGMIGAELAQYEDYDLITGEDLRQMVALEAEKQSVGCSDDSSCLAELAGAMGARYVVFGEVGKLDNIIVVNLNLFDSQEAKGAGRVMVRANGLGRVPDKIPSAIGILLSGGKKRKVGDASHNQIMSAQSDVFPWPVVGSMGGTAIMGLGLALGWGLPSFLAMLQAEEVFFAAGADHPESAAYFDAAEQAQQDYWGGPAWGLIFGSLVGVACGSYAGWVIYEHQNL